MKAPPGNHQDCANFLPVDVAKGLCSHSGEMVFIDTPPCGDFAPARQCWGCRHFSTERDGETGTCGGFETPATAYPGLRAMNCDRFSEKTGTGKQR